MTRGSRRQSPPARIRMTPEEAFQLLSRVSQNINRKVREISADLVQGRIDREMFRPVQGE